MQALSLFNRNLDHIELQPPSTAYHDPLFIAGDWYYHLSLTFAAWVYRAVTRAKEASALTADLAARYDHFRTTARMALGSTLDAVPALAAQKVNLPPIPPEWFSLTFLAASGVAAGPDLPPWSTFAADAARAGVSV